MSFRLAAMVLTFALSCIAQSAESPSLQITTAHGSRDELETAVKIKALPTQYDLRPYLFTRSIVIDQDAIPHSHPVLTIHTRHLLQPDELLSTLVHEELHWHLDAHLAQTKAAEADLRSRYHHVPVGYPDGGVDEESTYLHLIDCFLELKADRRLMGAKRTDAVFRLWSADHYRWVYRTVISDEPAIAAIVKAHQLDVR